MDVVNSDDPYSQYTFVRGDGMHTPPSDTALQARLQRQIRSNEVLRERCRRTPVSKRRGTVDAVTSLSSVRVCDVKRFFVGDGGSLTHVNY